MQHHDSTAHKIPSHLQAALVGKVTNFGKRFEVFQSQGSLFYQESIWALLPHVHSIPTFPGRGMNHDTLQRSRLAFNNSLHLQIQSVCLALCLKTGLLKLLVHCSRANQCTWSLHPLVHAGGDRCKAGDEDHYLQLGQSLDGFQRPQDP